MRRHNTAATMKKLEVMLRLEFLQPGFLRSNLRSYQIEGLAPWFAEGWDADMDGIKLKVPAEEMKLHLERRAEHHDKRANQKEAELPKIKEAAEAIKRMPQVEGVDTSRPSFSNKTSMHCAADLESQVDALERDIRNHRSRSQSLSFMAAHLFDEDYTLSICELRELKFIGRE